MLRTLLCLVILFISTSSKLYQVVSMFRHGARYHLNKYYDYNVSNGVWGEFTAVGMRQHQNLGKMLRRDYIEKQGFLSENYNQSQIDVFSTRVNRTYQSAITQLYGLYPLGTGVKMLEVDPVFHIPPFSSSQDASDKEFSLPLGYQSIGIVNNISIIPLGGCPRGTVEREKNWNYRIDTVNEMNLTYYPFLKRMGQIFNFTEITFSSLFGLYDTLVVDKYLGRPMPSNFTDADYENLRHLAYWYDLLKEDFNISKAYNTNVLRRVLEDFDDRINNLEDKPLKWTFLSAHDTNLFAIENDLNISSADCIEEQFRKGKTDALNCQPGPQFAANLIFELHSDNDKDFYVKLRFNGQDIFLCEKKDVTCDYDEWKSRAQSIMLDNADEICYGIKNQEGNFDTVEADEVGFAYS